jgi:hypothetical protein
VCRGQAPRMLRHSLLLLLTATDCCYLLLQQRHVCCVSGALQVLRELEWMECSRTQLRISVGAVRLAATRLGLVAAGGTA